ncbi:hypothetical protein PARPLA_01335 [Rhodobacteraceae bacterium THAF1]|uniref:hypothetical protein n=1 Tax=Palleronia sp. THAF1 TaxID=2587842 RepID=UPI000F3CB0A5|nr:hypothetical protein [Palleronia sp. THAF1]QFU09483.1 hypothetical protein FIU81_12425 [Palleronia sp. THAF1]VDC21838.1 hypothetical protein PARPLA_01335 [Rhodobacteraceae bacterium THAF1]
MLSDTITMAWARLNPSEPSSGYLIKLMAFMVACFIGGLLIGGVPDEERPGPIEAAASQ